MRIPIPILVAVISLCTLATAASSAPLVLLANPGTESPWPENEIQYAVTFDQLWWDGRDFTDQACECPKLAGHVFQFPAEPADDDPVRTLFVPALIWTTPDFFTAASPIEYLRQQGTYLANRMNNDPDFDVQLGLDPTSTGQIEALFPQDFDTVATASLSIGELKASFVRHR